MEFAFVSEINNPDDSTYIKYTEISRLPYLNCLIAGKNILINFDTGASGWLYFPSIMQDSINLKTSIKKSKKVWNNQTGITQSTYVQLRDNISFGNYVIMEPTVVFLPEIEDVFVGSSLLKNFKLTFYTSQKLVKMESVLENNIIIVPDIKATDDN